MARSSGAKWRTEAHLVAVVTVVVGLVLGALPANAQAEDDSHHYFCRVDQTDARGRVFLDAFVALDGSPFDYHVSWIAPDRAIGMRVQLYGEGARLPLRNDEMDVVITMRNEWQSRRRLRVELWRNATRHQRANAVFAGPLTRPDEGIIRAWAQLSDVRALATGLSVLNVVAVDSLGNERARDRLEISLLDTGMRAIEEARAELDTLLANYQSRCSRQDANIILT